MVALQSQRILQRRMDVAAMNMANVSTSGFKADELVVEEAARTNASAEDNPHNVRFARDVTVVRNMAQGPITHTGNDLDAAIEGSGFFMVQGQGGQTLYTRDGAFTLNQDGQLVTSDGRPVLSSGGAPITVEANAQSITIGRDGAVTVDGNQTGTIGVVDFARPGALEKVGQNLWSANGQPSRAFTGVVIQGALEGSNVNPVAELTNLIEISRAYQSAARVVSGADDLRQRAIQRLGQAA
jgi:flagellar basal-body rod protein FlgF